MWIVGLLVLLALTCPHKTGVVCAGGCDPSGPEVASALTQAVAARGENPLIQPDAPGGCVCPQTLCTESRHPCQRQSRTDR
jgi:hypothetical protein